MNQMNLVMKMLIKNQIQHNHKNNNKKKRNMVENKAKFLNYIQQYISHIPYFQLLSSTHSFYMNKNNNQFPYEDFLAVSVVTRASEMQSLLLIHQNEIEQMFNIQFFKEETEIQKIEPNDNIAIKISRRDEQEPKSVYFMVLFIYDDQIEILRSDAKKKLVGEFFTKFKTKELNCIAPKIINAKSISFQFFFSLEIEDKTKISSFSKQFYVS